MTERRKWSIVWGAWAAYFGIAEYIAVRSRHKDAPLSAHCRYVLATNRDRTQRRLGQIILGSGIVWFIRHLYNQES